MFKFLNLCAFLYFVSLVTSQSVDDVEYCTIETESGFIRGKENYTLFDSKLYYSFRGIPFAKPPINDLRFKAPVKNDPWLGVLDAFNFKDECLQKSLHNIFGSENCLYLNVFVPLNCAQINSSAKLPVLIYIYGGIFLFGTPRYMMPDFLIDNDVIVVTFSYRLGIMGLVSLNLPEYSGNMAMKDQRQVLRWVNENIERFGGDKNRVTLSGHSSGSICTNFHVMSPQSKHLFQRGLMLEASALNSLLPSSGEFYTNLLYGLARNLNFPASNKYDLIKFLNQIDGEVLVNRLYPNLKFMDNGRVGFYVWNFIVEPKDAIDPFLTELPFDILTSDNYESNIDTLYTVAPMEYINVDRNQFDTESLKRIDEIFEFELPLGKEPMDFDSAAYKDISNNIRNFYFGGGSVKTPNIPQLFDLLSDINLVYGMDLTTRIQAKKSTGRTYYSQFSVDTDFSFSNKYTQSANLPVRFSMHVDLLYYLFRYTESPVGDAFSDKYYQNLDTTTRKIIQNTAKFFADFIKFGNPMPNDEPIVLKMPNSNHLNYFDIRNEGIFAETDLNEVRMKFWDDIFTNYKHELNTTFNFHILRDDVSL
ncbi:esterase B1-like [Contarinia nasturtii]|uniref:esterase B1-like n=1 Tax=Contarinia nasturtii TaxID=265458 RepID=UPI0012D48DD0|nr:esterase B1-like [Contarinia nasturtii]